MPVVITDIPRPPEALVQGYRELDVATVHKVQERKGLLVSYLRPIYRPAKMWVQLSPVRWRQVITG